MAASMMMAVFWVAAPCSLVEVYLMMKPASTYETLVNLYQSTWCYSSEDSHLHAIISSLPQVTG
jgi:hypothetical protein